MPMPRAINPIPRSGMDPQFDNAVAHRLRIAQVAGFNLAKSCSDANLGNFVANAAKPFGIWFAPILLLVTDEFDRGVVVA